MHKVLHSAIDEATPSGVTQSEGVPVRATVTLWSEFRLLALYEILTSGVAFPAATTTVASTCNQDSHSTAAMLT
jgi:hypothetical protein